MPYVDMDLDGAKKDAKTDRDKLVLQWVPLALSLANRHFTGNPYYDQDDRQGVALWALLYAAERFERSKGEFASYASRVIWDKLNRGRRIYKTVPAAEMQDIYERNRSIHDSRYAGDVVEEEACLSDMVELVFCVLDPRDKEIAEAFVAGASPREVAKATPGLKYTDACAFRAKIASELAQVIGDAA